MHPFSVMQSFPTGRFVTLCFYCFFLAEIVFSGYKKTALRLSVLDRYHPINTGIPKRHHQKGYLKGYL